MSRSRFPRTRLLRIVALGAIAAFGASCKASLQDYCSRRIPELEKGVEHAQLALGPWSREGRAPASTVDSTAALDPVELLAPEDRKSWEEWAEVRLKEAQHYLDLTEELPPGEARDRLRTELSQLANEIVSFHGFASSGRASKMLESLRKLRAATGEVRGLACADQR